MCHTSFCIYVCSTWAHCNISLMHEGVTTFTAPAPNRIWERPDYSQSEHTGIICRYYRHSCSHLMLFKRSVIVDTSDISNLCQVRFPWQLCISLQLAPVTRETVALALTCIAVRTYEVHKLQGSLRHVHFFFVLIQPVARSWLAIITALPANSTDY